MSLGGAVSVFHKIKGTITPLKKRVLVSDMHFGMTKTKGGIILQDDDGSADGIHPRWAKVYKQATLIQAEQNKCLLYQATINSLQIKNKSSIIVLWIHFG